MLAEPGGVRFKVALSLWLGLSCCVYFFQACDGKQTGGSFFSESQPKSQADKKLESSEDAAGETTELHRHTQSFTVQASETQVARPVHMLWVVDTSGSMRDEVQAVSEGLASFASGLGGSGESSIKVSILGNLERFSPGISEKLQKAGIHTVLTGVSSYDQLSVIASYLSPDQYREYGLVQDPAECEADAPSQVPPASVLSDHPDEKFFKDPKAFKVIVVVSDEGECSCNVPLGVAERERLGTGGKVRPELASKCLIRLMSDLGYDSSTLRFYGFLNLDFPASPTSLGGFRVNRAYKHLASDWGGKLWHVSNIPPEKWQDVLAEAQSTILSEVLQNVFTLEAPVAEIQEVKVEGVVLAESAYYADAGKLHINASEVKKGSEVEVVYLSKQKP